MSQKTKYDSVAEKEKGSYDSKADNEAFNSFARILQNASKEFSAMGPVKISREGFPKRLLITFAKKISVSIQELSNILHISERTLQRYDDDATIKTEYAEKAVELARLYTRGQEVFGSMDKFKTWAKTPSLVFNGETPVSLLDTSAGFDMVFRELGRIEHGIFA